MERERSRSREREHEPLEQKTITNGPKKEIRPGDWMCGSCNAHNFASRSQCFKCGWRNPNAPPPMQNFSGGGGGGGGSFRDGDWYCYCGAHNYASRSQCFKCHTPKPMSEGFGYGARGGGGGAFGGGGGGGFGGGFGATGFNGGAYGGGFNGGYGRMYGGAYNTKMYPQQKNAGKTQMRPGDWVCVCYAHNYSSRTSCYKCGRSKDDEQQTMPAESRKFTERPGDWHCSACEAHNFATRNSCFKCGKEKGSDDRVIAAPADGSVLTSLDLTTDAVPSFAPPMNS